MAPAPSIQELIATQNWPKVLARIKSRKGKKEAGKKRVDGDHPIHLACCSRAPVDVVQAILLAYPGCAYCRNKYGALPIHDACHNGASADVVRILLEANPSGVRTNVSGTTVLPIHCSITLSSPAKSYTAEKEEVIATLLKWYPEGAAAFDDNDQLPLHVASKNQPSMRVLKALLAAYPEGATTRDCYNLLPIHYLRSYGNNPEVVRALEHATIAVDEKNVRDIHMTIPVVFTWNVDALPKQRPPSFKTLANATTSEEATLTAY